MKVKLFYLYSGLCKSDFHCKFFPETKQIEIFIINIRSVFLKKSIFQTEHFFLNTQINYGCRILLKINPISIITLVRKVLVQFSWWKLELKKLFPERMLVVKQFCIFFCSRVLLIFFKSVKRTGHFWGAYNRSYSLTHFWGAYNCSYSLGRLWQWLPE